MEISISYSMGINFRTRIDDWLGINLIFPLRYRLKSQWDFSLVSSSVGAYLRNDLLSSGRYKCIRDGRRATADGIPEEQEESRCDLGLGRRATYVGKADGNSAKVGDS